MQIHTVKPHDTIFKIARAYSVSPMKIIEDNDLKAPDKLAVGQKLLIITPTRTYNVRGSDTIERIIARFDMSESELLRKNPYLRGGEGIYPGEILSIKHNTPPHGTAYANGYFYEGTTPERLALAMPYISYLTIAAAKRVGDRVKTAFNPKWALDAAKGGGKIPLLRIYDEEVEFPDAYLTSIEKAVTEDGYGGVTVAAYRAMREGARAFSEFIVRLTERMRERGLLVFLEIDGNTSLPLPDGCDGYVINYEKCHLEAIPDFNSGEREAMFRIASELSPMRCYIDLSPYAYRGDEEMLISDAVDTAIGAGQEIQYDADKKISYFHYNKYLGGKRESVRVAFEALENIKAKLDLIAELGFMGISFDVMRVPIPYLMAFEATFASAVS